ncbi:MULTISPECIES: restriction endonuclease subunit S [Enterococcus]|uniref:restriction endonuclease subunit S n=1 Tax=Enterococcus TaxID=1350 RepID=UPI00189A3355|nr:restriction endonuclease subunit S [Enterococcus faecium]MDB7367447.1 restriction endonuclease subunit S [Enterococcus faecium]MDB7521302.1 restriction endonuclease subunit S [Enterococcus faecium]MDB7523764.1 restriction endonuclease subunit S [Enterococcus faecium]MDB7526470.1 restriction endonuclease subunit S [Enterococcus faecium]MDB7529067.1 restriction endonuclease subunit S [Enterococcus faecium]
MSNDIQPEIRFPGFTEDWEQRKLSEGTSKIGDGLHGTPNYSDNGDVFFINGNNLVNGKIVITKETKLVTESNQSKDDKLLNRDTILMSINGTIGNLAWYNNERVMLGKSAAYLTVSNFDKKFIFSYLQTSTIKNYFLNNLTGTTIKNLGLKTIRDTTLFVPTLEEQQKIGSLFKQLDDTIALHQRKLDLLKETKKGFLQKMFPKNGAKVPEIRFPGFTGDWEQRKLGQVANYRRGSFPQPYGNKEWYDGENSMPFVQVVDVGDNLRLVEDTKQKISELAQPKSVFVEEGKVVVTLQGSIGRVAITQYPAYVDRTLLIFESYKAEMDEYYFAYVIQQLFEYEKTRAPGGTIKTITKEALSNFTISFPSIAEQKKLGKFFEQLDDTIALHQRKLDLLKETKKGFLQKMFV